MRDFPVLKIELEGVRQAVAHALVSREESINKMILQSLEEQLTEDWVVESINAAVKQCLVKSIQEVSDNWTLRGAISKLIAESVSKLVQGDKK